MKFNNETLKEAVKELSPLLKDPNYLVKDHIYHSFIRQGNLVEAIRDKRYRMIRWTNLKVKKNVVYELYDYVKDPEERVIIENQNKYISKKAYSFLINIQTDDEFIMERLKAYKN